MNILIVQTGFLGDVILSTPVIANVQFLFPEARISFLTTPAAKSLVAYHPAIAEVIVYDKRGQDSGFAGFRRMVNLLRVKNFDIVFSLHKSLRTALLLRWAQIPKRFGFREAAGSWLYSKTAPRRQYAHEVLRNLAILETQGVPMERLRTDMFIGLDSVAELEAEKLLETFTAQGQPLLGIAPGSVWATKRWTPSGFAEVARHFAGLGYGVIMIGGAQDEALAEEIARKSGVPCLNTVGKLSLPTSAAVIKRLQLLLTNDSAPLHIASAMQTPLVALFCATVPEFGFSPWEVPSECVGVAGLSCRPCRRHGGNSCPTGTHACQLQLSPAMVVQAAERVLQKAQDRESIRARAGTTSSHSGVTSRIVT